MIQNYNDIISVVFTEEGFTYSNCVLVDDSKKVMIDSGAGKILKSIDPPSVEQLLISHHHIDHINGNDYCSNAVICAHEYEKESMQNPYKTTATCGWGELMDEDIMKYANGLSGSMRRVLEPWNVHETINDRDLIDCGRTKIMVLHTPGHTTGHCSFYFPEEEFIFTGDICLSQVGPWYGDPDTSIDDFIESIDLVIGLKPKAVATGHVQEIITDNISKKLSEYKERIFKRERRVTNFLRKGPATIDEMAARKLIYGLHPNSFVLFWEKSMIKKHLDRLIDHGIVEKTDDNRFALTT